MGQKPPKWGFTRKKAIFSDFRQKWLFLRFFRDFSPVATGQKGVRNADFGENPQKRLKVPDPGSRGFPARGVLHQPLAAGPRGPAGGTPRNGVGGGVPWHTERRARARAARRVAVFSVVEVSFRLLLAICLTPQSLVLCLYLTGLGLLRPPRGGRAFPRKEEGGPLRPPSGLPPPPGTAGPRREGLM